MISQFFILSPRGDVIIRRDYLGNVTKVGLLSLMLKRHAGGHVAVASLCADTIAFNRRLALKSSSGKASSIRMEKRHHQSSLLMG